MSTITISWWWRYSKCSTLGGCMQQGQLICLRSAGISYGQCYMRGGNSLTKTAKHSLYTWEDCTLPHLPTEYLRQCSQCRTNPPPNVTMHMAHRGQATPPDSPQGTTKHTAACIVTCTTKCVRGSPGTCWMPNKLPTKTTIRGQASPVDWIPHGLIPGGAQQQS